MRIFNALLATVALILTASMNPQNYQAQDIWQVNRFNLSPDFF